MSAIDVLRSFAESRSADHELVLDGITYRHCREACAEIARLTEAVRVRDEWRWKQAFVRSGAEIVVHRRCLLCGALEVHGCRMDCLTRTHPLEPPKDPGQLPDDGPGGDHEAD